MKKVKIFSYKTWAEEKVTECGHFQICEITAIYFKFLKWTIKINKKFFPRKFYNYWKVYNNTPK